MCLPDRGGKTYWRYMCRLNITLVKLEAVQQRATQGITKSDDDYDTRLSKLKLL